MPLRRNGDAVSPERPPRFLDTEAAAVSCGGFPVLTPRCARFIAVNHDFGKRERFRLRRFVPAHPYIADGRLPFASRKVYAPFVGFGREARFVRRFRGGFFDNRSESGSGRGCRFGLSGRCHRLFVRRTAHGGFARSRGRFVRLVFAPDHPPTPPVPADFRQKRRLPRFFPALRVHVLNQNALHVHGVRQNDPDRRVRGRVRANLRSARRGRIRKAAPGQGIVLADISRERCRHR